MVLPFHGRELARDFSGIDHNVVKEFRQGIETIFLKFAWWSNWFCWRIWEQYSKWRKSQRWKLQHDFFALWIYHFI